MHTADRILAETFAEIFTDAPAYPTGANINNPFSTQRNTIRPASSASGSVPPGTIMCTEATRPFP